MQAIRNPFGRFGQSTQESLDVSTKALLERYTRPIHKHTAAVNFADCATHYQCRLAISSLLGIGLRG